MNQTLIYPSEDGRSMLDVQKRRHGSGGDIAGFGFDGGKDAVSFAAGGIEVGGF